MRYILYRLKWFLSKYFVFKYPTHIDLELSSVCDLRCHFCPQSSLETDFKRGFMSPELVKKIIDEIAGKVPSIKLNLRGESTMHPEFIKILDYVKNKFVDVRLNTNGNYPFICNKKIAEVCTNVTLSANHAYKKTYERITGGGNYSDFWANVDKLYKICPKKLTLSYVITDKNRAELSAFRKKTAKKYPKAKLFIRDEMRRGKLSILHRRKLGDKIEVERKNCYMPNRRLAVSSDGTVYPCCVMWEKPFLMLGSALDGKILDLWQGRKIKNIRCFLKTGLAFSHIKACASCGSSESYVWEDQNG